MDQRDIPGDIEPTDLDRDVREELRSLPRPVADLVARHLVAAGRLLEDSPEEALAHTLAARRSASRISAVREAVGLAAYRAGEWQTAITELRTYHRMSGRRTHLAVLADCERALGRPSKAIDIYRSIQPGELSAAETVELLIVAAGARSDLGQPDAAVAMLDIPELAEERPWAARLQYAYADALVAAGRQADAREWFARAAGADADGETDAAERLLEMDGIVMEVDEPDQPADQQAASTPEAEPARSVEDADPEPDPSMLDDELADLDEDAELAEDTQREGVEREDAFVEPEDEPFATDAEQPGEPVPLDEPAGTAPVPAQLVDSYDLVILDLDGVVYLGEEPIPGAVKAIERLRHEGPPVIFATNNASRSAEEVAALLVRLGVEATADEVLTSAEVAADALAERLSPDAPVLVVGSEALVAEVRRVGLVVVDDAAARPEAVVQGYAPHVGWSQLAEASLAIRAGAQWIVTNTDTSLPSPRGAVPGNGALVAVVRTALGREPDLVVGKPRPALFTAAAARTGAARPLVVGDRLDTDIQGAVEAGIDSLLVLTGISTVEDTGDAGPNRRPTFVGADLAALFEPPQPAGA